MIHLICGCLLHGDLEILLCPAAAGLDQARQVALGVLIVAAPKDHPVAYRRWRDTEHDYAGHFAQLSLEAA